MTHPHDIVNDDWTQAEPGHLQESSGNSPVGLPPDTDPNLQQPRAAGTLANLKSPAVQYCRLTDLVLDNTRLALMVRQLHYLLGLDGGVTHGGHHWIYQSHSGWLDTFGWRSERAVRRVVDAGRKLGVIVVIPRGGHLPNLYRLDYLELRRRFIHADTPFPDWFPRLADVPEPDSLQPDMLFQASADEVVEKAGQGDRIGHPFYTEITNRELPPPPAPPGQGQEADTAKILCSLCGLSELVDVTEIEIVEQFRSEELEVHWITTDVYGDCRCCRDCRERDALSEGKCAACLVKEHWVDVVHGELGWRSATAASKKYLEDPSDLLLAIEAAGAGRKRRYMR